MCFQFYKITEQCYVQMNVYTVYSKVLFPCRLCLSTVFARLFICLLIIVSNNVFRRLFIYIQIVHIIVYMWMLNHWPFQFRKWYSISRLDAQTDFENPEKSGVSKSHLTVLLSNFKFFEPCSSIFCFWMSLMSLLLSSLTLIHHPLLLSIVSFCWILTQEFVSHYKPPLQGGDLTVKFLVSHPGQPGPCPPKTSSGSIPGLWGFHIAILIASGWREIAWKHQRYTYKCSDLIQICETKCKNLQMNGI